MRDSTRKSSIRDSYIGRPTLRDHWSCCVDRPSPFRRSIPGDRLRAAARTLVPLLPCLILAGLTSCDDEPAPGGGADSTAGVYDMTFERPEFEDARRIDTIMNVDLDDDGRLEYIVASILPEENLPPLARADLVQIYRFDTVAAGYAPVATDSVHWTAEYTLRDVTGDRLPDLLVRVNSGGNDLVASSGLYVYSGHGGSIRAVYRSTSGDPALATIEQVQGDAILVHDLFWPIFASHAEAAPYVSDILAFKVGPEGAGKGKFASVRGEQSRYFLKEAENYLTQYRDARNLPPVDTTGMDSTAIDSAIYTREVGLFNPAALTMIAFRNAGNGRSLRSFWDSERLYLQSELAPDRFTTLDSMYANAVMK